MSEKDDEKRLSVKQIQALECLSTGGRIAGAAAAAGVSETTVGRWVRDPAFSAELRRLEGELLRGLGRRILALGEQAAAALQDALGDYQPMGHRLRAADLVTSRGPQLAELTAVIERLEDLERRVADAATSEGGTG